jgi:ubiquinone/menaquinone biosynthesis C-methylase UbiE
MSSHSQFVGSIPELYDRYLGPVVMLPYAEDLARRIHLVGPARVLELACGTGILTRRLREALPAEAFLVATDLNQPMIDYARPKFTGVPGLEWRQADATRLPFDEAEFDAVVCQFGVMFFPDKAAAAREVARVLKPGGIFLFNVWDGFEHNGFARIVHETVGSFFDSNPPDFCLTPFGYHNPQTIRALLTHAGFSDIAVTEVPLGSEGPSAEDLARGVVEGNPLAITIRERGVEIGKVRAAVTAAIARAFGDKPVTLKLQALVVSGKKSAVPT